MHPSEEFEDDKSLLAGPYHPSFKEMAMTAIWEEKLKTIKVTKKDLSIFVKPNQINFVIGYKAKNKKKLLLEK